MNYTFSYPLWLLCRATLLLAALAASATGAETVGKAQRILIERGPQILGMITKDDAFDPGVYHKANFTTTGWLWQTPENGPPTGFPWARWVFDEIQMPSGAELSAIKQLVALQLGDEWDLNSASVRDRAVNWFDAIRDKWPNTILYMNNWGGQINDAALGDFIARARPDMLSFDTYPYQADPGTHAPNGPAFGSPTNWYAELRRYRIYAANAGIPVAVYRQTFHSIEGTEREYRSPSPSEMNLNTFAALAFGATVLMDFTYNTGASTVAPHGQPGPAYSQQSEINRRARNFGKTLVHLTGLHNPLDGTLSGGPPTMDVLFVRGHTGDKNSPLTPLPPGFVPHAGATTAAFSEWKSDQNDPYMRGWSVTGRDGVPNKGDAIIAWFKPLESSKDDPQDPVDQLYFMVVNGHTGHTGTAADYRQRIQINFLDTVGPTVQRLNADTGRVELVKLDVIPKSGGRRKLVVELDGGMGALFKFNTGHPFLGTMAAGRQNIGVGKVGSN